jgi:hypothetical protein
LRASRCVRLKRRECSRLSVDASSKVPAGAGSSCWLKSDTNHSKCISRPASTAASFSPNLSASTTVTALERSNMDTG